MTHPYREMVVSAPPVPLLRRLRLFVGRRLCWLFGHRWEVTRWRVSEEWRRKLSWVDRVELYFPLSGGYDELGVGMPYDAECSRCERTYEGVDPGHPDSVVVDTKAGVESDTSVRPSNQECVR